MKPVVPFILLLGVTSLPGCAERPGGASRESADAFCGRALARVDSFMATLPAGRRGRAVRGDGRRGDRLPS